MTGRPVSIQDTGVGAFWSYAHEDDQLDGGSILRLAERLKAEFALVTGQSLRLFVDRDGIGWGDEWRSRIASALVETTFFIPILSPRYFTRPECRRELLDFHAQAASIGVTELILPILYVTVPDLRDDNADEAVALVARMQYEDWTNLRLADVASADFRRAVNSLAGRLASLVQVIAAKQLKDELRLEGNGDDAAGLMDVLGQIRAVLPEWYEVVVRSQVVSVQRDATKRHYMDRLTKLESSHAPSSAHFAILQRLAVDETKLIQPAVPAAQTYYALTIKLDPLIRRAVRIVDAHSDAVPLLRELEATLEEAWTEIDRNDANRRAGGELGSAFATRYAHVSRAMKRLAALHAARERFALEANDLVRQWRELLHQAYATPENVARAIDASPE
jgi:hypothetical protein